LAAAHVWHAALADAGVTVEQKPMTNSMLDPPWRGFVCPSNERSSVISAEGPGRSTEAEAEHLAVERPNDRLICVTVRLDMDPGPNELPDQLRWSQERMRRPISSLICSSKAANQPKPTNRHNSSQLGSSLAACGDESAQRSQMRGVNVISPHRPDDQRATIYDSLLLAHVWTNCTGEDKC
jgi:hypothetical protein